ncbi:type VII toxin-antitoxin system HepT family RNase toxin [Caloranaerobacter sp. DY30410]|uniref:type VII toxin-antitoxin system HepT family RNase toxin n=1 Tax=Caloranaerobacter sp. DY30410 TaxID=3238305 RepID=UPI003D0114B9
MEYNFFIAINMIIDMAMHIVTDERLGYAKTFGEAFEILHKKGYISREELDTYRSMMGLRNILLHEYIKINKKLVYDVMQNRLDDFVIFFLQGLYNSIIGRNIMIFLKAILAVVILCLLCRILLIFIAKINGIK